MAVNARGPVRLARKASRAAMGGAIVIVALLLAMFLRGPGTGEGDSSGTTDSSGDATFVASADSSDVMLEASDESGGLTELEQSALSGNTLLVLIDEHDYLVRVSGDAGDAWQQIKLDRLIEVAQHATGDSNGIRIRIQKRSTARASAEQKILTELEQAGIGRDAIFESSELTD